MTLHYTLFAQAPDDALSSGVNASVDLQDNYYGLFAQDNAGIVSAVASIQVIYVLNHYALFGEYLGDVSLPLVDSCIVSPMQVPRNLRIIEQYTTHRTIKLEWDNLTGIDKYGVYIKNLETGQAWHFDTIHNTYIAINLQPNQIYEFKVAAYIGNGFYSELSQSVVAATLSAFFGEIVANATTTTIDLSWEAVTGASYYKIFFGVPGSSTTTNYSLFAMTSTGGLSSSVSIAELDLAAVIVDVTTFSLAGLLPDQQFYFYLIAYDDQDIPLTAASTYVATLAEQPDAPDVFAYIIKEITATSITIAWTMAARAHYCRIHLNNNPEAYADFIYNSEFKITSLRPDTIYTITIVAVNTGGENAAPPFAVRTAKVSTNLLAPDAPRLIYPNCSQITTASKPSLYWQIPDNNTNVAYEFIAEIANNTDFIAPLVANSGHSKTGFSFTTTVSPIQQDNQPSVSYTTQSELTKPPK